MPQPREEVIRPVIEIPVQSGPDPLSALALCLLSWVALAWSVVAVVRLLI